MRDELNGRVLKKASLQWDVINFDVFNHKLVHNASFSLNNNKKIHIKYFSCSLFFFTEFEKPNHDDKCVGRTGKHFWDASLVNGGNRENILNCVSNELEIKIEWKLIQLMHLFSYRRIFDWVYAQGQCSTMIPKKILEKIDSFYATRECFSIWIPFVFFLILRMHKVWCNQLWKKIYLKIQHCFSKRNFTGPSTTLILLSSSYRKVRSQINWLL